VAGGERQPTLFVSPVGSRADRDTEHKAHHLASSSALKIRRHPASGVPSGALRAGQVGAPGGTRRGEVRSDLLLAGARGADAVQREDEATWFGAADGGVTAQAGVHAACCLMTSGLGAAIRLAAEDESHGGGGPVWGDGEF
jgi:hypothetical protein